MVITTSTPNDIARRLKAQRDKSRWLNGRDISDGSDCWLRDSYKLPRPEARLKARELLQQFPPAAYMTEIEFWQEHSDGQIEFIMRRLPSAD